MSLSRLWGYLKEKPIQGLLPFFLLAIISEIWRWGDLVTFIFSALAIIPLAGIIGDATETLAHITGPRLGGLLNATLGNAAELIITIIAIQNGLLELVKASITGSILGNILFVMGTSFFLGGLRFGDQSYDRRHAGRNSILLLLAVFTLVIPSVLSAAIGPANSVKVETLSLGVGGLMMLLYVASLIYGLNPSNNLSLSSSGVITVQKNKLEKDQSAHQQLSHHSYSRSSALLLLALSTAGVAYMSELLVGTIEHVIVNLGVSEFFLGVILIPIIGNIAEHLVAVKVALQNKMELSVEIAISSSLQIALLVAPLLVFISLFLGNPLQLIFNPVELLALIVGVVITVFVAQDGESNWLEGAELLAIYLILGLAFFLLPK